MAKQSDLRRRIGEHARIVLFLLLGCSNEAPRTDRSSEPSAAEPGPAASSVRTSASAPVTMTPTATPAAAIAFPPVAGWQREAPEELGYEPGFSLGYNREESASGPIAVTVYVYKRELARVPTGASSEAVKGQVDGAIDAINELVRRGEYRSATVLTRDKTTLGPAGSGVEAQRASLKLVHSDGTVRHSTVLVTGAKDHFVKLRFSHSEKLDLADTKALEELLQALGGALRE